MKIKALQTFALIFVLVLGIGSYAQTIEVSEDEISIIVTSDTPSDLAAAEALAAKIGAEVVVVDWGTFTIGDLTEVQELGADSVYIIGGEHAIPEGTETLIESIGAESERIAGDDRYETSALIAEAGWGTSETVVMADGLDDISIEHAKELAIEEGTPIVYTKGNDIPEEVTTAIDGLEATEVTVITSPDITETEIEGELEIIGIGEVQFEDVATEEEHTTEALKSLEFGIAYQNGKIGDIENSDDAAAAKLLEKSISLYEQAKTLKEEGNNGAAYALIKEAFALNMYIDHLNDGVEVPHLQNEYNSYKSEYQQYDEERYEEYRQQYKSRYSGAVEFEKADREKYSEYQSQGYYVPHYATENFEKESGDYVRPGSTFYNAVTGEYVKVESGGYYDARTGEISSAPIEGGAIQWTPPEDYTGPLPVGYTGEIPEGYTGGYAGSYHEGTYSGSYSGGEYQGYTGSSSGSYEGGTYTGGEEGYSGSYEGGYSGGEYYGGTGDGGGQYYDSGSGSGGTYDSGSTGGTYDSGSGSGSYGGGDSGGYGDGGGYGGGGNGGGDGSGGAPSGGLVSENPEKKECESYFLWACISYK